MRAINCAKLLMAMALASACGTSTTASSGYATTPAPAATYTVTNDADVQVFYEDLAPYGRWVHHPVYGSVWVPRDSGFEPYRNGRWIYTDQGYTWVSDQPFGWTTTHYGHWVRDASFGWAWVPGREWQTANVTFYDAGDALGWAPVGPDGRVYEEDIRYVPYNQFSSPDVERYYVRGGVEYRARARRIDVLRPELLQRHAVYVEAQPVVIRRVNIDRSLSIAEQRRLLAEQRAYYDQIRRDRQARLDAERRNEAQRREVLARERAAAAPEPRVDREVDRAQKQLLEHLKKLDEAEMQSLLAKLKRMDEREKLDLDRRHASARSYARLTERQNDRRQRDIDDLQRKQRDRTEDELRRLRASEPSRLR